MKIKLNVDYNEDHKKGSDGEGLSDDLKRRLVKSGLADKVAPATAATSEPQAKPRAKPKGKTAARLAQSAPEGHRPLAGSPTPPAAQPADAAEQ